MLTALGFLYTLWNFWNHPYSYCFFPSLQHLMYSTFDAWGEFIFRKGLFSYWYLGNSSFWRYDLIWVSSMRLRHEPAAWHCTSSLSGKSLHGVTFVWFIRARYCSTQTCLSRDEYRADPLPAQLFRGCQIQGLRSLSGAFWFLCCVSGHLVQHQNSAEGGWATASVKLIN